jgi:hypothetical protein
MRLATIAVPLTFLAHPHITTPHQCYRLVSLPALLKNDPPPTPPNPTRPKPLHPERQRGYFVWICENKPYLCVIIAKVMNEYQTFLETKRVSFDPSGFDIDQSALNPILFPFQKFCVQRALKSGKYALFEDCGLGKTMQQIEFAHQVAMHEFAPVLILCPLAVSRQTIAEGVKMGYEVLKYAGDAIGPQIYITNYEQLENIDCSQFAGVVLDESSIIKSFDGATRNLILDKFAATKFKLACTATPSPNDPMELGNHAEFLGVMKYTEMLAMYFVHVSSDTSKWRLKGHAEAPFYAWIATWAVMIANPKDIGFEMDGYNLPPLNIEEIEIATEKKDNGLLFNDNAVSATNHNAELRITILPRLEAAAALVNASNEPWIVWVKQNEEDAQMTKMIDGAVSVKGSDRPDQKESRLIGFANNEFRVLVTKPKIAQFGLNYQNCSNQIFVAPDFSFEGLYQAIRRSYRFGQKNEVNIYLVVTDTMENISAALRRKQAQFEAMQQRMADAFTDSLVRDGVIRRPYNSEPLKNEHFTLICGDSFQLIKQIGTETIDGCIFSPPFSSLYTYSDSSEDLSNCLSHDQFYQHFEFMVPELLRITKAGRCVGMHLTQLTTGIAKHGFYSIVDFRGEIIRLFQKHGFLFHMEVTIWKDPQLAAVRTKNHQLLHGSTKKDSTICRAGLADYLIVMRKRGANAEPVNHEGNGIPFEKWCKIASPVWMDISESDVLKFRNGKGEDDERHITPTQLPVIENFLTLYTNPNDTIFSPFAGIGSEIYQAVKMGRKAIGFELKESYFELAKQNSQIAVAEVAAKQTQLALF